MISIYINLLTNKFKYAALKFTEVLWSYKPVLRLNIFSKVRSFIKSNLYKFTIPSHYNRVKSQFSTNFSLFITWESQASYSLSCYWQASKVSIFLWFLLLDIAFTWQLSSQSTTFTFNLQKLQFTEVSSLLELYATLACTWSYVFIQHCQYMLILFNDK